jgi:hypothetical protein
MLYKNPPTYVNAIARLIAHGAFNSGSLISSVIWAVASELGVSHHLRYSTNGDTIVSHGPAVKVSNPFRGVRRKVITDLTDRKPKRKLNPTGVQPDTDSTLVKTYFASCRSCALASSAIAPVDRCVRRRLELQRRWEEKLTRDQDSNMEDNVGSCHLLHLRSI